MIERRRLLGGGAALAGLGSFGLGGCASGPLRLAVPASSALSSPGRSIAPPRKVLTPVRASMDRVFDITVCLRPFRAAGPRIEAERLGDVLVVHNYGHGGSGWSLSWGSAEVAVGLAIQANLGREIAVVGCGALGITAAITAQRTGAKVTIYAKDLLPRTRSARATGVWSPDSRIALADRTPPGFGDLWEQMSRTSFRTYRSYLGLPGSPVEFIDQYILSDASMDGPRTPHPGALAFAEFGDRIHDIVPHSARMADNSAPFPVHFARHANVLRFNIADYSHMLMNDFLIAGGRIEQREFRVPSELQTLPQKVVINCPGYGARALWKDESITPVRGQISWMIPQPELTYGFIYRGVAVLPRRDGVVVQGLAGGDMRGYGDDNEAADAAETAQTVGVAADLAVRMEAFNAAARSG